MRYLFSSRLQPFGIFVCGGEVGSMSVPWLSLSTCFVVQGLLAVDVEPLVSVIQVFAGLWGSLTLARLSSTTHRRPRLPPGGVHCPAPRRIGGRASELPGPELPRYRCVEWPHGPATAGANGRGAYCEQETKVQSGSLLCC